MQGDCLKKQIVTILLVINPKKKTIRIHFQSALTKSSMLRRMGISGGASAIPWGHMTHVIYVDFFFLLHFQRKL